MVIPLSQFPHLGRERGHLHPCEVSVQRHSSALRSVSDSQEDSKYEPLTSIRGALSEDVSFASIVELIALGHFP